MPAMNCATPPNAAANGNRKVGDLVSPYQPARFAATMKVADAKPNSPRIDGAAIGWRTTRVCSRQFERSLVPLRCGFFPPPLVVQGGASPPVRADLRRRSPA